MIKEYLDNQLSTQERRKVLIFLVVAPPCADGYGRDNMCWRNDGRTDVCGKGLARRTRDGGDGSSDHLEDFFGALSVSKMICE